MRKLLWLVPLGLALSVVIADAGKPGKPGDDQGEDEQNAPEFDMRASGAALALLAGGVLLLSDLRRRKDTERH